MDMEEETMTIELSLSGLSMALFCALATMTLVAMAGVSWVCGGAAVHKSHKSDVGYSQKEREICQKT